MRNDKDNNDNNSIIFSRDNFFDDREIKFGIHHYSEQIRKDSKNMYAIYLISSAK